MEPAVDYVHEAAKRLMGVDYLFPYQRLVVANILEAAVAAGIGVEGAEDAREDAGSMGRQIVILPTGAGKSLCFQLPALMLDRPTLVIYPILSLMSDQERRLRDRGFSPVVLRGGQDEAEREAAWRRLESGEARFAIANPEVLLAERTLRRLGSVGFAHLVVDEAHCVSEWGESFRPSYLRIAEILSACGAPLCTAFTATASPPVLEKIDSYVFGPSRAARIVGDPDRPNIRYEAVGTLLRDRTAADLAFSGERPAIVFCASRARAERLARSLRAERPDVGVRFYHAGLERAEKDAAERWFFGSADGILTATCAYGMGVDKGNIRTVIHRDCPPSVEAYLQESGRAGRDGAPSRAVLLWGPEDLRLAELMGTGAGKDRIVALMAYARDALRCRREALLELLGAECGCCSGCDVCDGRASAEYRERRSIRDFIERNGRRYLLSEAADRYARAAGGGWTEEDARRALEQLRREGDIRTCGRFLWKGALAAGRPGRSAAPKDALAPNPPARPPRSPDRAEGERAWS
jgi:ATP-dependent DNA helicase RecQ